MLFTTLDRRIHLASAARLITEGRACIPGRRVYHQCSMEMQPHAQAHQRYRFSGFTLVAQSRCRTGLKRPATDDGNKRCRAETRKIAAIP